MSRPITPDASYPEVPRPAGQERSAPGPCKSSEMDRPALAPLTKPCCSPSGVDRSSDPARRASFLVGRTSSDVCKAASFDVSRSPRSSAVELSSTSFTGVVAPVSTAEASVDELLRREEAADELAGERAPLRRSSAASAATGLSL